MTVILYVEDMTEWLFYPLPGIIYFGGCHVPGMGMTQQYTEALWYTAVVFEIVLVYATRTAAALLLLV